MTAMTKCATNGCDRKGEWAVEMHIPAKGWAIEAHQPLSIICDMPLCRDHATEANLLQAMPDLRNGIRDVIGAVGRAEPDFDRAWTTPIRRTSPKFLDFERSRVGTSH